MPDTPKMPKAERLRHLLLAANLLIPDAYGNAIRPGRYLWGNPATRFALMFYPESRWTVRKPRGGFILGKLGIWWTS